MTNNHTPTKILTMPYRDIYTIENRYLSDEDICLKARLCGVEIIRMIQAGIIQPDKERVRILESINQSLEDYGKPTLCLGFLANK